MSWGELLFVDGLTPEQREMFNKLKPVAAGYQREVAEREPAQRTTELARRRGLQACRAIEADLGAIYGADGGSVSGGSGALLARPLRLAKL